MVALLLFVSLGLSNPDIRAEIRVDEQKVIHRFVPQNALGAGVDGHEHGDIRGIYTAGNIAAMRSMGMRSLTYRLRTELGIEAWHWNPKGSWSDKANKQGYWISSPRPGRRIDVCYGYSLPRRGDTVDQANNRGYSRLDDGDRTSFWKSNPYLDERYTGEPNSKHPQWIVVDFGDKKPIDSVRFDWGEPYAKAYRVEYWAGPPRVDEVDPPTGQWTTFSMGTIRHGKGGLETVRLCGEPVQAQYVRIWLTSGSGTAPAGSRDVRDRLGFAVRELGLGPTDSRGRFHDEMVHRRDAQQTETIVSSTDPWHRASDLDRDVEQPGFDLVEKSGLTNRLPMLVPVPVLYGVPEDSANELRWLRARQYEVRGVEMGEEPDGQMADPEDYGSLYLQVADRIRAAHSSLPLGGPCFQTTQHEFRDWPDPRGTPWLRRFLTYLHGKRRDGDLQFFSFEWYPFDDVAANPTPQLLAHEGIFSKTIQRLMSEGLTHTIPWMITEYGYSAFAGPSEVEMPGAILNVDIVGEFLSMGGGAAFLYGYEPGEVIREKTGAWGNLMALQSRPDENTPAKLSTYYAAWLLTHAWCGDLAQEHQMLETDVSQEGDPWIGAYALSRPDGKLAVMIVNRNPTHRATVSLPGFRRGGILYQYGPAQYEWKPAGENGHPLRSSPPLRTRLEDASKIELQHYSVNVLVFDKP